jgi:phosphonate ABC transporter permease subunit PhnE
MEQNKPSILKSLGKALIAILVIVVFAYGVKVTDVNFETTQSENRLRQLTRVIRALVQPDIVEYETEDTEYNIPFYLPCPEGETVEAPEQDLEKPHLIASSYCAAPKEIITIEGYNFIPNSKGPLNFITFNGVRKQLGNFQADSEGYFEMRVELPTRQPVAEAQQISALSRVSIGSPKLTLTAKVTWEKIIETVFMALLATAIGTAAAIPLSFLAARNLMAENRSPLTSISLSLIGWPAGIILGLLITKYLRGFLLQTLNNTLLAFAGILIGGGLIFILLKWSIKPEETEQIPASTRILRVILMILAGFISIIVMVFLEIIAKNVGRALIEPLGAFGFLGNFFYQLGEASYLIIPGITALAIGAGIGGTLSKFGQTLSDKSPASVVKIANLFIATAAGAILFALAGAGINWLYQIDNLTRTLYIPAAIGGALGLVAAILTRPKQSLPTGLSLYLIIRTILNGTRSVESLVMAIVFVIWVGMGPFAGSLALALHTLAALAKLYSEQVESILPGPLEAIQATGANRLQTIVYAVVPQIVSPYISFTMYRWDINVRMSTIIGFVGGGGIGFLLQQNINLLNYRAASVQMLAIAVVVALMDYISSVVRERMI